MVRVTENLKTLERSYIFGNKKPERGVEGVSAGTKLCNALLAVLRVLVFPKSIGSDQRVVSSEVT